MDAMAAAAARLHSRDADLAAADQTLAHLLGETYRQAVGAITRIEGIRAEVDAVAVGRTVAGPAEGAELARFLVAKNREILAVLTEARAVAGATANALRDLSQSYRSSAQH